MSPAFCAATESRIASILQRMKGIVDLLEMTSTGPGRVRMTLRSQSSSCIPRFWFV